MFWRELSAFLANLSGMWWSHGVELENKCSCSSDHWWWVWELPQVLGFRGTSVESTEPTPCQLQDDDLGHGTFQPFPLVHTWARFHQQCVKEFAAFQSSPQVPHQKTSPNYTTGTNWIIISAFQQRGWGVNSMQTKLSREFPRTAPWMQCCKRLMWHLKKHRFQVLRLLQFSTFTSIQIHLH